MPVIEDKNATYSANPFNPDGRQAIATLVEQRRRDYGKWGIPGWEEIKRYFQKAFAPRKEKEPTQPPGNRPGGPYAAHIGEPLNVRRAYEMLSNDALANYSISLGRQRDVEAEARRLYVVDKDKNVFAYERNGRIRLAHDAPLGTSFKALSHEVGAMRLYDLFPDFNHAANEDIVTAEGESVERAYLARAA